MLWALFLQAMSGLGRRRSTEPDHFVVCATSVLEWVGAPKQRGDTLIFTWGINEDAVRAGRATVGAGLT